MEKLNILPQTVYKFSCSDLNLINDVRSNLEKEEWINNTYNLQSSNYRLEKSPLYEDLHKWFHACLQKVKDDMQFECDYLKITQSWANRSKVGNWHHPHTHSNSFISGIFYVTNSNAETWFSIKNIWNSMSVEDHPSFVVDWRGDESFRVIHKQKTISGDLIIFPSNLFHSVTEHKNLQQDRFSISFNSFPCGKIGKYFKLGALEISIL